jgi:hypothetical protein
MEQINDAGLCGWNSFNFDAFNAHGRLVGLASDLTQTSDAALFAIL